MSELIIYPTDETRPDTQYQDGDILCAFTDRRISQCHIQRLTNPVKAGFTSGGLRPDDLSRLVAEAVYKYRMERVGKTEVKRITLADMGEEILSDTPNAKGEAIAVAEYLQRRKKHARHRIYGTTGAEIWYGGAENWSVDNIAALWALVEGETAHRAVDYKKWPLTPKEKAHFLALPTEPMSEAAAHRAENVEIDFDEAQPEFDLESGVGGIVMRKRRAYIDWRAHAGVSASQVLNKSVMLDLHDTVTPLAPVDAQAKPRKYIWSERAHLNAGAFVG